MNSKLIALPLKYLKGEKKRPLTPMMFVALIESCIKQHKGIPFGPIDIKGSFSALVNRGLIVRKSVTVHEHKEPLWQLTEEAIELLKATGLKF